MESETRPDDEHPRSASLRLAATYRREVAASLPRVWENVFDWEHLPALHADSFGPVELLERGPWGWRVRLRPRAGDPGRAQIVELRADVAAGCYCAATLEGPGAGSEVLTQLTARSAARTGVEVAFHVPETSPARLAAIGARYRHLYARLWDEDEAMMRARDRALRAAARRPAGRPRARRLGALDAVRARLPLTVRFGGQRFRIIEVDGVLTVHSATCPHWLGPLDAAPLVDGCVRCPWHGYHFDVRSGLSADGRGLRLATPPRLEIRDGQVELRPAAR